MADYPVNTNSWRNFQVAGFSAIELLTGGMFTHQNFLIVCFYKVKVCRTPI